MSASELTDYQAQAEAAKKTALRTGMTIALAIGLHNFAEGLAIGVSASTARSRSPQCWWSASHSTTRPRDSGSSARSAACGRAGPGSASPGWWAAAPRFVGAIVGYQGHSDPLELGFYALAGGAILYVIGEIWTASAATATTSSG